MLSEDPTMELAVLQCSQLPAGLQGGLVTGWPARAACSWQILYTASARLGGCGGLQKEERCGEDTTSGGERETPSPGGHELLASMAAAPRPSPPGFSSRPLDCM